MSTDESLASLKKQRKIIKGSCMRIKTYVDSIVDPTSSIIAQLEERKTKLNQYWSDYNSVQSRVEVLEDAQRSRFFRRIFLCLIRQDSRIFESYTTNAYRHNTFNITIEFARDVEHNNSRALAKAKSSYFFRQIR